MDMIIGSFADITGDADRWRPGGWETNKRTSKASLSIILHQKMVRDIYMKLFPELVDILKSVTPRTAQSIYAVTHALLQAEYNARKWMHHAAVLDLEQA